MQAMPLPRVPAILPLKGFRPKPALGFSPIEDPVQVTASLALKRRNDYRAGVEAGSLGDSCMLRMYQ
jgi:hypothetical protein